MTTYKYNGEDTREFPTIGLTVKPGDTFEASDDFVAHNVKPSKSTKPAPKVGDEE